jgi:hypothetical protein
MRLRTGSKSALLGLAGSAIGITLAVGLTAPAHAASPATDDPTPTPPALQAWLATPTIQSTDAAHASSTGSAVGNAATTQSIKQTSETDGSRISEYRGSVLLWTENYLEWYWTTKKITSSKGWQTDGYVFPNTAKLGGIKKTYSATTSQNWRAVETVGAGVVTPWGDVDVYESSYTDYFTVHRGGEYSYSN